MPKNQVDRTIDNPYSRRTGGGVSVTVTGGGGAPGGVTDHGLLTGLADDECIAICSEIFDEENDYRYVLAIPVGCIRAIRVLNAGAA